LLLLLSFVVAQDYDSVFVKAGSIQSASGIWIPKLKSHKVKPGLILWFHGGMQSGNCTKGLQAGKALFPWIAGRDMVVASASVCRDQHWLTPGGLDAIESLIDSVRKHVLIDTNRIELVGVSDGGFGVMNYSLNGRLPIAHRTLISTFAGAWVAEDAISQIRPRVSNGTWTFLQGGHDTFFPATRTRPWMNSFCAQVPHCTIYWEDAGEHDMGWWTAKQPQLLSKVLNPTHK